MKNKKFTEFFLRKNGYANNQSNIPLAHLPLPVAGGSGIFSTITTPSITDDAAMYSLPANSARSLKPNSTGVVCVYK